MKTYQHIPLLLSGYFGIDATYFGIDATTRHKARSRRLLGSVVRVKISTFVRCTKPARMMKAIQTGVDLQRLFPWTSDCRSIVLIAIFALVKAARADETHELGKACRHFLKAEARAVNR